MVKSILLVGVGGQGTILAGKLLTTGLLTKGYDVKMSEIHGMSQRGGSVSTHVRYGDKVHSPVIELGGADMLVAFERMEALRWLEYLKPGGIVIVNDYAIPPMPVISGKAIYPDDIIDEIRAIAPDTLAVDAAGQAAAMVSPKVMNVMLLGAVIKRMGLEDIAWDEIIRQNTKPEFADINIKALELGKNF